MTEVKIPTEEFTNKELEIHNESIFTLDQTLRDHPKLEAKYYRWYAQANKEVNRISLQVEVVTAELTDDICKEENISPSARSEVRRSRIAKSKRYQAIKAQLNDAIEIKEVLEGLTKSWSGRGFRLMEIAKLSERLLWPEPRVHSSRSLNDESKIESASRHLSID